jgi:hypothetical protein
MASALECWGRGDEIEEILKPILNRGKRSAVLLYGDSGIGKSTVLREIRTRLNMPGIVVGFHETSQADSDPLLRTLDDLLKQIYTVEGSAKQIRIACEKAKSFCSVSGLKDFLVATLKAAGDSGGLGAFAKGVTSFFGWAVDKVSALDASVPAGLMPKLGLDALTDILRLLRTALPEEQLVFLVDNLSAPAEAVTAEIRGFSTLDTIQAFLSQRYGEMQGLHFVFSWKLSEQSQGAFRALSSTFREYKGTLQALRPIRQVDELSNWLRHEFAWFRELDSVEVRRVIALTGGLPEIVVRWRESGVDIYDENRLAHIAEDTRNGRFQSLRDALEGAPASDMIAIYGLALVTHPMPVSALAAMVKRPPQTCLDVLRAWEKRWLLRSRIYAGDPLPVYQFDHEHKLEIALEVLPLQLADGGEELERGAYDFFLSHFSLARFDRPTSQNPCSGLYLLDAIQLLSRSRFLVEEAELRPLLEMAVRMAVLGETPDAPPILDWGFLKRWPYPFRGWFLDLCLATAYGPQEPILDMVENWLAEPSAAGGSVGLAFAEATASANLMGRMRGHERPDLMGLLLDRMFSLQRQFPKSPLLAKEAGKAIVNAIGILSDPQRAGVVDRLLERLTEIEAKFSTDAEIIRTRMIAVANAIVYHNRTKDLNKTEQLLSDLRALANKLPDDALAAEALAKGLASATVTYKERDNQQKLDQILTELRTVRERFPKDSVIAYEAGSALVNAIPREAAEIAQIDSQLAELRGLRDALSGEDAAGLLAAGINNAVITLINSQNSAAAKPLLEELKTLWAERPDSLPIAEISADSIGGAIAGYAIAQDIEQVSALIEQLRTLVARFPQDPMPRHLAKGLANAVMGHAQLKLGDQNKGLVHELLAMVDASRGDAVIALQAARGLAVSIVGAQNPGDASELAAQLIQLHLRFPDDRGVREMLAQGAINAVAMLGSFHELETAAQFVNITRTFSAAAPGDIRMEASHAEMLAAAIAGYATEGDVAAVDRFVAEVKELRRQTSAFPILFQCARAFAQASTAYGNRREMVKLGSVLNWLRVLSEEWPQDREMAGQFAWGLFNALMVNACIGDDATGRRIKREWGELEGKFPNLRTGDPAGPRIRWI